MSRGVLWRAARRPALAATAFDQLSNGDGFVAARAQGADAEGVEGVALFAAFAFLGAGVADVHGRRAVGRQVGAWLFVQAVAQKPQALANRSAGLTGRRAANGALVTCLRGASRL